MDMGDKQHTSGGKTQTRASASKQKEETEEDSIMATLKLLRKEMENMRKGLTQVVKIEDIQGIVDSAMKKAMGTIKKELIEETKRVVNKAVGELEDKMESIMYDVDDFREEMQKKDDKIKELTDRCNEIEQCARNAERAANHNEQYSRKYNIRLRGLPQTENENLRDIFIKKTREITGQVLDKRDIVAIHRLPASFSPKPVIVKCFNSEVKSAIMKHRTQFKDTADLYLADDITKANIGLMNRLNSHADIDYSWYFNCNIYAKSLETQRRVKFDIFSDIDSVLNENKQKSNKR